jgi:hypothetical protein
MEQNIEQLNLTYNELIKKKEELEKEIYNTSLQISVVSNQLRKQTWSKEEWEIKNFWWQEYAAPPGTIDIFRIYGFPTS